MAKGKGESGRLSVFKGRETKLNKAIFQILALKGPLTVYDIHREVKARKGLRHTRYASVNKRVRFLEDTGYIKKIGFKKTKAGFQASIYELTIKTYLAILLNSINFDELLMQVDDATAQIILATILTLKNLANE